MDGCHAVEITSFGGIDGKFPQSVPKQPELKNHQINMAKSSMQPAKIIATTQRNATHLRQNVIFIVFKYILFVIRVIQSLNSQYVPSSSVFNVMLAMFHNLL